MSPCKSLFSAVTTFNLTKHPHGVEMINSFFMNWPEEVTLTAFIENSSPIDDNAVKHKIIIKEYHEQIPKYKKFFETYKSKEKYTDDFRFNVFRFAYKVYAIEQALKEVKTKYLIWLDADIKTYKKIPLTFLKSLVDNDSYMSYLGRENNSAEHLRYSECGFLIFNTDHLIHTTFWIDMMKMYDSGELFKEKEWHDSYIFDVVRKKLEKTKNIKNFNISDMDIFNLNNRLNSNDYHVFVVSVLGKFMDHKKGNRKQFKWSRELILRVQEENKGKL